MKITYPPLVFDRLVDLGRSTGELRERQAREHFEAMRRWIMFDVVPRVVLDIGSGLALIDVLIARVTPGLREVHLLDGDGGGRRVHGFHDRLDPWFDVELGAEVVRANTHGVKVVTHGPSCDFTGMRPDLVISCRAWGHHFPISTYAKKVRGCLAPGGVVILDIRKNTDGLEEMKRAGFLPVEQLPDHSSKCKRWVFQ